MKIGDIEVYANIYISRAYCKCGDQLTVVDDGFINSAFYCPKCEKFYECKLVAIPDKKTNKKYLKQLKQKAEK
jgi:hypothetical protein